MKAKESEQLTRQWKMLQMLSDSRTGVLLRDLVVEFEVCQRSISRDLKVLQAAGFPIEEHIGERRRKRWKMKPFAELFGFTYADLISMIMSRRFLEPMAGTPFWEGHQKVIQKVKGALGEHAIRYCEKLNSMLRVSGFGQSDYTKRGQLIDTLIQAMEEKRRVLVVYRSASASEATERELGPQGLIWHNGSLYLIAWSEQNQEIRNYKVDRIEEVTLGPQLKYVIPEDFSLEVWQKKAFGVFYGGGSDEYVAVIRFSRDATRYVQESHWHDSQQFFKQADGTVHMQVHVTELSAVTKWILSFGRNAVPLEPPELVESVRNELMQMLASCSPTRQSP